MSPRKGCSYYQQLLFLALHQKVPIFATPRRNACGTFILSFATFLFISSCCSTAFLHLTAESTLSSSYRILLFSIVFFRSGDLLRRQQERQSRLAMSK